MNLRNLIAAFTFLTALVVILVIASSSKHSEDHEGLKRSKADDSFTGVTNCMVKPPSSMEFAGEKVPLDDPEVYERLDREIHVNTYWHSSTFQILKLANRWLPRIESILKEEKIPEDFKYLVVAESGFMHVVSPAGAAGYWQFLKNTGQEYGLEIYSEVDQRYHLEASTKAACRYLHESYGKFGNWTLVAASYNMGRNRTQEELAGQGVKSYYDLLLNNETSRYVFRLLAFKLILSDPHAYGFCFDLEDLYQPLKTKKITARITIDNLNQFALDQKTNLKTLRYLNPWLRDDKLTISEGNTYEIELPNW